MSDVVDRLLQTDSFDSHDFRRALGSFVTGVTVVTTKDVSGLPRGFTANSFTSVSLDPPLVLVCIGRTLTTHPIFEVTQNFAINVLSEHQKHISNIFASRGQDRFDTVPWHNGKWGAPILNESAAWFECDVHNRVVAGDHLILIGRVNSYGHAPIRPLGYFRGFYAAVHSESDGIAEPSRHTRIGAILECRGQLILTVSESVDRFGILSARSLGSAGEPASLHGKLHSLGVDATLDCLFSVYDDESSDVLNVYYRGTANSLPTIASCRSIAVNAIPWDKLESETVRIMLRRYVEERAVSTFSIYAGNKERGNYQKVVDPPLI